MINVSERNVSICRFSPQKLCGSSDNYLVAIKPMNSILESVSWKANCSSLFKKFSFLYGTQGVNIAFTRAGRVAEIRLYRPHWTSSAEI
jgi:hypothetical protein